MRRRWGRWTALVSFVVLLLAGGVAGQATVQDVLLSLFTRRQAAITEASQVLASSGLQPPLDTHGARLPACPAASHVLLDAGGRWPHNWSSLSAEEQAGHAITPVALQLAFAAYLPASQIKACLAGMGADVASLTVVQQEVPEYSSRRTAIVFRAGRERVFVSVQGSNAWQDVTINAACRHASPDAALFGGQAVRVHRGFWRAWQVLEPGIVSAVGAALKQVPSGEVYVLGHSLGAAVGAIGALRLSSLLPSLAPKARVAGVWLFAPPRAFSPATARLYDGRLMAQTMRFVNYRDFAVVVPEQDQRCSTGGTALSSATAQFGYAHAGRAVLLCPAGGSGLMQWRAFANGTEAAQCGREDVDASGSTHQLGSYFDSWRRAHVAAKGTSLAGDPVIASVLCQGCALATQPQIRLEQVAPVARAGGPVTCSSPDSCSPRAFEAAAALGAGAFTAAWLPGTACRDFLCQAHA